MNRYKAISIISVILIFIMMIVTVTAVVQPQRTRADEANEQAAQIEQQNAQLREYIDHLIVEQGRITIIQGQLQGLQSQIPAGYQQQDFISQLNQVATDSGVNLSSVSFSTATLASFPTVATSQLTIGVPVQVPFTISASGTYDQLRDFVDKLQNMIRIAVPNTIQYTLDEETGGQNAEETSAVISATMWSMLTNSTAVSGANATNANANAAAIE